MAVRAWRAVQHLGKAGKVPQVIDGQHRVRRVALQGHADGGGTQGVGQHGLGIEAGVVLADDHDGDVGVGLAQFACDVVASQPARPDPMVTTASDLVVSF